MSTRVHAMLPDTSHDEQARQDFVRQFRRFLSHEVMPGTRQVFESDVRPAFCKEHGRDFENYHEVRKQMIRNDYYQFWSAMQRRSQEMMWESVIDPAERQWEELIETYRTVANERPAGGSLRLDGNLEVPKYHTAVDIHIQPGGYHTERTDDDVLAGVFYEAGLPIYIDGQLGPESDGIGRTLSAYCQHAFPVFLPVKILDMGCAVGNSTLPWVRAFPGAEVHAIDVAAPCLRFAHARAESLGEVVHFSQQNAEKTDFDDESFDLVVSHIVFHETSKPALGNIIEESFRLLKPGGMMLHLDVPRGGNDFERFMSQWETYNNNETFSSYMTDVDLEALAASRGFSKQNVSKVFVSPTGESIKHSYGDNSFAWPVLQATK